MHSKRRTISHTDRCCYQQGRPCRVGRGVDFPLSGIRENIFGFCVTRSRNGRASSIFVGFDPRTTIPSLSSRNQHRNRFSSRSYSLGGGREVDACSYPSPAPLMVAQQSSSSTRLLHPSSRRCITTGRGYPVSKGGSHGNH